MSRYIGDVSAYALAVSQGYTGTEEEYAELMASYATVGQTAVTAAQTATTKASEAATSATTATNKASEAMTAAQTATSKAAEASTSASTATSAKDTAVGASQTATTKAGEATTAAATATSAATTATTAKDDAVSAKTAAQTAKTAAETAQTAAEEAARTLTIDTTLTQTGQAADAKKTGDEISDLKEEISNNILDGYSPYYTMLDMVVTSYRALHPNTGLPYETGSDLYHIRKADVTPGKAYLLSASTRAASGSCFYAFYNSSDEVVLKGENSQIYATITVENLIDKYVVAPTSAAYVLVADYFAAGGSYIGIKGTVSEIHPAIPQIDNRVKAHEFVNNYFVDITAELSLVAGYLDANGKVVSYASAETTNYLDISAYPHYVVSGSPLYASNRLWAIYDYNYHVLQTYRNNTVENDYDFDVASILETYPTAKYVRFSSVFASGGIHMVVKRSSYTDEAATYAIENDAKIWSGKKWVCIGDSLTEANSRTTKHYYDYVSEKTGITVAIYAGSGSGYKNPSSVDNKTFYQRAAEIPTDADVVTVFGSGNDLTHGYTLGNVTDTGTTTICGCINTTLDALIARIPAIQLGIVAPTPWIDFPPSTAGNAMDQYVEALKTICENRSIPFLDLYHCSNLRPWTAEGRTACYSKDDGNGVHPDETGHKLIAPRFKGFLNFLLV